MAIIHRRAAAAIAALLLAGSVAAAALLFDDFSYTDGAQLEQGGWQRRVAAGHPGPAGAQWLPVGVTLVDDEERPGNRLLRLDAATDGTPTGTRQAQLCHARKFFRGTYAARVRFTDAPAVGPDGDPAIQAFYAIGALRHDFDPEFSELDFEYLPNGGWGSERTRLYAISWHTVQIEPWQAFNSAHEEFGSQAGWHLLTMVVEAQETRHYLDGKLLKRHRGRNVPVTPMSINFSLWFSPAGLLPDATERRYHFDVDWVLHVKDRSLRPAEVLAEVRRLRRQGISFRDTVAPAEPPLLSECRL